MSETNLHSPRQLRQQFSCARSPGGFALLPASDRAAKFDPAYTARRQIAGTALANGSSSLRDGNFDGVVCVAGIGFDVICRLRPSLVLYAVAPMVALLHSVPFRIP